MRAATGYFLDCFLFIALIVLLFLIFSLVSPAGSPFTGTADLNHVVPPPGILGCFCGKPMDINSATIQDLDLLPGIGPVTAIRLRNAISQKGGVISLSELEWLPWTEGIPQADLLKCYFY